MIVQPQTQMHLGEKVNIAFCVVGVHNRLLK